MVLGYFIFRFIPGDDFRLFYCCSISGDGFRLFFAPTFPSNTEPVDAKERNRLCYIIRYNSFSI